MKKKSIRIRIKDKEKGGGIIKVPELKFICMKRGITLSQLATKLKYSSRAGFYHSLNTGRIQVHKLLNICEILECNISQIIHHKTYSENEK